MNWKETYTKIFLNELGLELSEENIKEYMPLWWKNIRAKDEGGLRLTDSGYELLKKIDLKTYEIEYPKEMLMTTQTVIFLDNFIDCPYYIDKKHFVVTNERKAVELALFSGDLRKYGLAKALARQRKNAESG